MKRIGELDFVVEDGRLFLTCSSEKQCYDWNFSTLSRVPITSELKTRINVGNYKDPKRNIQLEIEFGLELEKISDEKGENKDKFSISFFIDDGYEDDLICSLSTLNLNSKSERTSLLPILKGTKLRLNGIYYRLKVNILNVKAI